ncbi:hypothetical protein LRR18_17620, partial [Mangrovimonas sp. AS39]|uniref:hypothetical protein n=1 Tax=Mangrovimonas futianensis TaxID=2895523 RepID=UPI001E30C60E
LLCAAYNLTNEVTTCGNVDKYFWLRCIPPHRGNPKIARVENYFGLLIASYDGKEFKKDLFE